MGQVIRVKATVDVPAGRFGEAIVTRDWTPLESEVVEEKAYAPGTGLVNEANVAWKAAGSTVVLVAHGVRG